MNIFLGNQPLAKARRMPAQASMRRLFVIDHMYPTDWGMGQTLKKRIEKW